LLKRVSKLLQNSDLYHKANKGQKSKIRYFLQLKSGHRQDKSSTKFCTADELSALEKNFLTSSTDLRHGQDKIFLDLFLTKVVVLKLAFWRKREASDFMMKQQISKIKRQGRNQSPSAGVVNTCGFVLPAVFAADFMKT
jgi:hypothetical protein